MGESGPQTSGKSVLGRFRVINAEASFVLPIR